MTHRKPAQDRRLEIIQTAMTLSAQVGPERVTTGMIAKHLNLTQPAIYKHFPSKDDIWASVAEHFAKRIDENVARAQTAKLTPVDRLRMVALDHLALVGKYPALPEIMLLRGLKGTQALVRGKLQNSVAEFRAEIEANIKAATQSGVFRPEINANDAALLVFGIIQSLVLRGLIRQDQEILTREGDRLLTLQLSGFKKMGNNG